MATPRADSYTVASGAGIYAGRFAGPAWLTTLSIGSWGQIPGTSGPGAGLNTNAYSDMTIRLSDATLVVVAAGGHSNGSSNAAASLKLSDDAPAWATLRASSWNGVEANVTHYADGSPASRHTYHHTHYIASLDAVLLAGCRFGWGGGTPTGPGMDLFSLSSRQYLPRNTWRDITLAGDYGVAQDGAGNIWTQTGYCFNVTSLTWSKPGSGSLLRYPAAYDSVRNRIFALQWADGEGFGSGISAVDFDPTTGNSRSITFNASAALTQFQTDAPQYAGMAYCPMDCKFYFLHPGRMNTFYVVTPNAGAVWDMATYTPGGAVPTSSGTLCKRLLWVPSLNGFVLQGSQANDLNFLKRA